MFFKFFKRKKKEDVSKEQIEGDRRDILGDGSVSKQELKAFKNDEYRNKKISDICNQILESNKLVKEDIIKFTVLSDKINDIVYFYTRLMHSHQHSVGCTRVHKEGTRRTNVCTHSNNNCFA